MKRRSVFLAIPAVFALIPLQAATVSKQHADRFARKLALIQQQAESNERVGARRTALTEDEVNSWFAYAAQPLLPAGLSQPQVTAVGQGKVMGQAMIDLAALGKGRSSGSSLDPFSLLGGRVPLSVTGILQARDGVGRFDLQGAYVSGVPVSPTIVQELLTYYSRTPERPQGVRLDAPFALPANIRQIEVGQGQAVVVQ
ncbi:MAG: hypothetical protein FJW14_12120 [Acidimicrobiia bacterium]|nr:hypothetical protein [Acidimicrobiia bacterium]